MKIIQFPVRGVIFRLYVSFLRKITCSFMLKGIPQATAFPPGANFEA